MSVSASERLQNTKFSRSFDYAYDAFCCLLEKFNSAHDMQKKIVIARRLGNLLMVLNFLANLQ